jgi:hypothetical protein
VRKHNSKGVSLLILLKERDDSTRFWQGDLECFLSIDYGATIVFLNEIDVSFEVGYHHGVHCLKDRGNKEMTNW